MPHLAELVQSAGAMGFVPVIILLVLTLNVFLFVLTCCIVFIFLLCRLILLNVAWTGMMMSFLVLAVAGRYCAFVLH